MDGLNVTPELVRSKVKPTLANIYVETNKLIYKKYY